MMHPRILLCLLALAVSLGAQGYRLEFKQAAGTKHVYRYDLRARGSLSLPDSPVMAFTAQTAFTALERIVSVKPGGNAVVSMALKHGNVILTSGEKTRRAAIPILLVQFDRSPLGEVGRVQTRGSFGEVSPTLKSLDNQWQYINQFGQQLQFPPTDLSIGDTWSVNGVIELAPGTTISVEGQNTLVGAKVVGGKTYLHIHSDFTLTLPRSEMTIGDPAARQRIALRLKMLGKSDTLFDAKAGCVFRTGFSAGLTLGVDVSGVEGKSGAMNGALQVSGTTTLRP